MNDSKTSMAAPSAAAQVAALPKLTTPELWALWDRYYPRRPAHTNRDYLKSLYACRAW